MNKWTINEDGYAMWWYHFPSDELRGRGIMFDYIIDQILKLGLETTLLKLKKDGIDSSLNLINEFVDFYKHKKSLSRFYPNINSAYLSADLVNNGEEYYFSSNHFIYNQDGNLDNFDISYKSIRNILKIVGHPYSKKGIKPLIHFKTGRTINKDLEILEYDICFNLNSDIWLDRVPCVHCENSFSNEDLLKSGGLKRATSYWYDNKELAEYNRGVLNSFMKLMHTFVKDMGGYIELNKGGMASYEKDLHVDGIYSD